MTAKYPVAFPSEFNDATETIATQISHATEALAAHISHATEIIGTRHLSHLSLRAIQARPMATTPMGLREETMQGWTARLMPSLVITLWFGLVFAILAVTAPTNPPKKVPRPTSVESTPTLSVLPPASVNAEEYSVRALMTEEVDK